MHINEISHNIAVQFAPAEQKVVEVKTTVDLNHLNERTPGQNIITKVEWVAWAGEIQGYVTLVDETTLLLDCDLNSVWITIHMSPGNQVFFTNPYRGTYYANGAKIVHYTLNSNEHDFIVRPKSFY